MKRFIKRLARRILRREHRRASVQHHEIRGLIITINKRMMSASQHPEIEKAMNRLQEILDITPEDLLDE
jgi:CBS-domain-containing membrane protein